MILDVDDEIFKISQNESYTRTVCLYFIFNIAYLNTILHFIQRFILDNKDNQAVPPVVIQVC